MTQDIYNELCRTGTEAAYARVAVRQRLPELAARCEAVYAAATADGDEVALDNIGAGLGVSCGECTLPKAIRADLQDFTNVVAETVYAD